MYIMKGKPSTVRFSQEAKTLLAAMAARRGISMSAMLEILIREAAKHEKKG
jgi:predicted HicB family RNase H-like nuclease